LRRMFLKLYRLTRVSLSRFREILTARHQNEQSVFRQMQGARVSVLGPGWVAKSIGVNNP
jgi:hypothetical protein